MSIEDLIDQIYNQDFTKAGPTFNELLQQKLTDAIDQEKINVASQVFGNVDDDDDQDIEDDDFEDDDFEEISDEEIGEIIDEEEDEE